MNAAGDDAGARVVVTLDLGSFLLEQQLMLLRLGWCRWWGSGQVCREGLDRAVEKELLKKSC